MLVKFSQFFLLEKLAGMGADLDNSGAAPPKAPPNEDKRIPTRLITSKKTTEDIHAPTHNADYQSMKKEPSLIDHAADLTKAYNIIPRRKTKGTSDQVVEHTIEHYKNNLLAIHDAIPKATRDRSRLWYDGAHEYTKQVAQKYGMHHASAAGVYAALSPQKSWYENVSLGDRVVHAMHNHQDHAYTDQMDHTAKKILPPELHQAIKGKTLRDLSDNSLHQAAWIRTHDEAHNSKNYNIIHPEGHKGGILRTGSGAPAQVRWQNFPAIAKAVDSIKADGDVRKISPLMGGKHKVRSFYNNIVAPNSKAGDVTIDTHAVAAAQYKPHGSSSTPVAHNFKNSVKEEGVKGAKSSAVSGIQGHYPIYHEAYRRAAAERGIHPREMQSITWEGVRGLFPDKMKATGGRRERADQHWADHAAGKISAEEARHRVAGEFHGKIIAPSWETHHYDPDEDTGGE